MGAQVSDQADVVAVVEPYLEPGEQVRQVVRARRGLRVDLRDQIYQVLVPFGFRLIAVTEASIVVFETDWRYRVRGILARLPRERLIGPLDDQWTKVPTVGAKLYVHHKFRDVVAEADHELWNTRSDWSYADAMALKAPAPEFM